MGVLAIHRRRTETDILSTWLVDEGGTLRLREEETGEELPIAAAAILAVFERYARPLAAAPPPPSRELVMITLADGRRARVRAFRFRAPVDVEPSDYLLLERDDAEPIAGPAPLLAAAMRHLAQAARSS
jgi:hypothetical protein